MFQRHIQSKLLQLLTEFPAVAILGARQVGKTTLAFQLAEALNALAGTLGASPLPRQILHLDLESPIDFAQLHDPASFFANNADKLVILDEVQRMPALFPVLRGVIDARRRAGQRTGQFLLLGSASADLLQQSSESLAGRLAYVELPTLALDELAATDNASLNQLWLRGGFPDSYLSASDAGSLRWRKQFITTYLERDIPQLGVRIPSETLRRFWTMLAYEQGQVLNAARLAASLGLSGQTIARYLDVMCDVMLVRRLEPWAKQSSKRLIRAPKVYVRDAGLVHALLDLDTPSKLLSHPVVGGSWEGLMIENLIAAAPSDTQVSYYRTAAGAEIDLVLNLPNRETWAIEVKRSSSPTLSKGFHVGVEDIKATHKIVTSNNDKTFPMGGDVHHVPLVTLMDQLRKLDI